MVVTPGVELAWSLAAREAVLARAAEVEPDHFFCALLKLAGLEEPALAALAAVLGGPRRLVAERDALRRALERAGLAAPAPLRHELRRLLGRGSSDTEPEALHRSDTARALFERAARSGGGTLDCPALLEALLARPTAAMVKALGRRGDGPLPPRPGQEVAEAPPARPLRALAPDGAPPPPLAATPQVAVLARLLAGPDRGPTLLVCAPGVDPVPLVCAAARQAVPARAVLLVSLEEGPGPVPLAAASADEVLLLDLVSPGLRRPGEAGPALRAAREAHGVRTIVAMTRDEHERSLREEADLLEPFRSVHLHDLRSLRVPAEL